MSKYRVLLQGLRDNSPNGWNDFINHLARGFNVSTEAAQAWIERPDGAIAASDDEAAAIRTRDFLIGIGGVAAVEMEAAFVPPLARLETPAPDPAEFVRTCPQCGHPIPSQEADCPSCRAFTMAQNPSGPVPLHSSYYMAPAEFREGEGKVYKCTASPVLRFYRDGKALIWSGAPVKVSRVDQALKAMLIIAMIPLLPIFSSSTLSSYSVPIVAIILTVSFIRYVTRPRPANGAQFVLDPSQAMRIVVDSRKKIIALLVLISGQKAWVSFKNFSNYDSILADFNRFGFRYMSGELNNSKDIPSWVGYVAIGLVAYIFFSLG